MTEDPKALLLSQTAAIVAAFVARNAMRASELPNLIGAVHDALSSKWGALFAGDEKGRQPAVPISQSVHPDCLVCLEDGKEFASLRRHIIAAHKLTPDQYRKKWQLPADYPMVAPNLANMRSMSALRVWREKRSQ